MTNKNGNVSIREVYKLLSEMETRLSFSIKALDDKFTAWELGKLTAVMNDLATLKEWRNNFEENQKSDPIRKIGIRIIEYIIMAVIASVMVFILK